MNSTFLTGIEETNKNFNNEAMQTKRATNEGLDKDAFLKLLITQLQYQDPLNPVEDRDFIAQMAQFTSLEQMQNINKTFERSQGCAMIGKEIDASVYIEGASRDVHGIVDSVIMQNGSVYVKVGDQEALAENVWQISTPLTD